MGMSESAGAYFMWTYHPETILSEGRDNHRWVLAQENSLRRQLTLTFGDPRGFLPLPGVCEGESWALVWEGAIYFC